jgi:hypothetical protein
VKQIDLSFLILWGVAACVPEDLPTGTAASEISASQGVDYQGVDYQGVDYQGVDYQGASYGGSAFSDVSVQGTAIVAWKQRPDLTWEQRFPDRICLWSAARTALISCTYVGLPGALAGTTFQATYLQNGATTQTTIEIQSVQPDTLPTSAPAMFALNGSTADWFPVNGAPGASCTLVAQGQRPPAGGPRCESPGGCRVNCDVWLYDVRTPGVLDASGQPASLCKDGKPAIALAGTWDRTGTFAPSSTLFTFACTNGTIAKCTRWGYRPWDTAFMSNGVSAPLAPYHQACIRAAVADYCADGRSWTRDGTLVDIYDYSSVGPQTAGFIQRTQGGVVATNLATALVSESIFDGHGAAWIDHTRYQGISTGSNSSDPQWLECGGRFEADLNYVLPGGAGGGLTQPVKRCSTPWCQVQDGGAVPIGSPRVSIDSTPVCAHSELMTGSWLHPVCSACTATVATYQNGAYAYCTQPGNRWDAACTQVAQSQCAASNRMASHSECVTGAGIGKYASGCALKLASTMDASTSPPSWPYDHCATSWDGACVSGANALCTGGMEAAGAPDVGFCGQSILNVSQWSYNVQIGGQLSAQSPAVAVLNGVAHLAHSGTTDTGIWWATYAPNHWDPNVKLGTQASSATPSLAGFNGHVYMTHVSANSGATQVWFDRFDTGTWSWRQDYQLPYQSVGSPTIAAYGSKLYLIGVTPGSNQLWWATMDANETFTPSQLLPYMYSSSPPSLAVLNNRLYMVHMAGVTNGMVLNSFDGVSWGPDLTIRGGLNGGQQFSNVQPAIAAYGGVLHMIHKETTGDGIWWSYYTPSTGVWSAEVSLPYNQRMDGFAALAALPTQLLMVHRGAGENTLWYSVFQ